MTITVSKEKLLFPTKIIVSEDSDFMSYRHDLITWMIDYSHKNETNHRSNYGGYQSPDNFYLEESFTPLLNRISEHILLNLSQIGIKNHFVKRLNMREQLVKLVDIIPIEFIVRNIATGSLTKRLGIEDGTVLDEPLLEYCLKDDNLGDPLIAKEHIYVFKWATKKEIDKIEKCLLRINDFMIGMFRGCLLYTSPSPRDQRGSGWAG